MGILEIISAALLILSCIFIVATVLMQESKKGMSGALTGSNADNYYQKNNSRTREAKLKRATRSAAVLIFVVTLLVNVAAAYSGKKSKSGDTADNFPVVTDIVTENSETETETETETEIQTDEEARSKPGTKANAETDSQTEAVTITAVTTEPGVSEKTSGTAG